MVVQGNVTLVEIEHPSELTSTERILSAVNFPTDELVYATWMNRVQNRAYFQLCNVDNLLLNCTIVGTSSSLAEVISLSLSPSLPSVSLSWPNGSSGARLIARFT